MKYITQFVKFLNYIILKPDMFVSHFGCPLTCVHIYKFVSIKIVYPLTFVYIKNLYKLH